MSNPIPRSAPEPQGVNPAAVTKFIDAVEAAKLELHSFMMLRHGSVVAEGSWKPYAMERPSMLFSLSKSFTSTAVGFAVSEGLLSLEDPVLKFFKEDAPEVPGKYWNEMKMRHLLTMSTGHGADMTDFMLNRPDRNWARGFLLQPLKHKPGTYFVYNTGASYMLSIIVQKVTGRRLLDYLTAKLFKPLGIEGATWERCPKGYDTGGFGLSLKTEDIAKFGQFLLQRGLWDGKQLLPAAWVDEATRSHMDSVTAKWSEDWSAGYGYQFWRCVPDCYRADGAFGQFCIVVPRLDAVIAITSGTADTQAVLNQLWAILLPAISEKTHEDRPARTAMEARLATLQYKTPALQAHSKLEKSVSGVAYVMERNKERFKNIRLDFSDDRCEANIVFRRSRMRMDCGRGFWLESACEDIVSPNVTPLPEVTASSTFAWEDANTLLIVSRNLNAPYVTTVRIRFAEGAIEVERAVNVRFRPMVLPVLKGAPAATE
jgi:CubicO group peptidase (beta-lactamase class C family)